MNDAIKRITINTILEAALATTFNEDDLPDTVRFYEIGIDSISMLSILLKLEKRLSVDLVALEEQIEAPVTVSDLFQLVDKLLQHATTNNQVNNV